MTIWEAMVGRVGLMKASKALLYVQTLVIFHVLHKRMPERVEELQDVTVLSRATLFRYQGYLREGTGMEDPEPVVQAAIEQLGAKRAASVGELRNLEVSWA